MKMDDSIVFFTFAIETRTVDVKK